MFAKETTVNARFAATNSVPAHVPRELVFDYDYIDDARLKDDLHEGVRSLLAQAPPIFYTPRYGGHWVAISQQAIYDITRDTKLFSSRKQTIGGEQGGFMIPINMDPPRHAVYRQPLSLAFSPKAMGAMEEKIRELVNQLIDKTIRPGHGSQCDVFRNPASGPRP